MREKLKQFGMYLISPKGQCRLSIVAIAIFIVLIILSTEKNFSFYSNIFCLLIWVNVLRSAYYTLGLIQGAEDMGEALLSILDKRIEETGEKINNAQNN